MDVDDLSVWANYNFLVFPEDDQECLKQFLWRETKIRTYISVVCPIFGYSSFAIFKYGFKFRLGSNMLLTGGLTFSLFNLFYYGLRKEKGLKLNEMYKKYQEEVQDPKYRGLKLYGGRSVNQVREREYTSSNLDHLKMLLSK